MSFVTLHPEWETPLYQQLYQAIREAIAMMTKASATIINAVVADVIAVPLFLTIRTALQRNHLWKGGKPGPAV